MQRVNVAYAANDMLGLLELQLEVEQIDQASLANLSEERIRQYNKVLTGQLNELAIEIAGFEQVAAMDMGADFFAVVTPGTVMRTLDRDIADMRIKVAIVDNELASLRDVKVLKAWMKAMPGSTSKRQQNDDLFW